MIWLKPLTSAAYPVQAQLGQVWWACRYNSTPQLMRVSAESYLVFTLVNILQLSIPACLTLVTYSWLSCNNTKDRRAIGASKISSSPVGVPYARHSRSFFVFCFCQQSCLLRDTACHSFFLLLFTRPYSHPTAMATETPSHILRKRTAAADMTVVENSVSRDSALRESTNGDLERGSGSSIAQHIAKLVAHDVGPSLLTVGVMLSLIFGGCCSNVRYHLSNPPTKELSHTELDQILTDLGLRS